MSNASRTLLRYAAVLPIVGASMLAAEIFHRLTGSDRLSAIFLAGVLVSAFLLGRGPAYLAAALAFASFLFMVDPRFRFTFGSLDDFNALMIFVLVSVLTSVLAGRMRDEAARSAGRQKTWATLLDATQAFSASLDEVTIRQQLTAELSRASRGEAHIHDGEDLPEHRTRETARADGWAMRPLLAGDAYLGMAAWRAPSDRTQRPDEAAMLDILVDTAAAAIARSRLAAAKSEAEARARTEDLRNALLSSISHDLRTPLTAILASAGTLKAFDRSLDDATRRDLASTIEEEAQRLDSFVANLLNMTRLEAGALTIERAPFSVTDVVRRTLERRRVQSRVRLPRAASNLPLALGDPLLFEHALGNVVENAVRYAGAGRLSIDSDAGEGTITVAIQDDGPGVAPEEVERIFEKFYRGRTPRRLPGTGLGLSIARGLMRAMGGEVTATAPDRGGTGLIVRLSLAAA